MNALFNLINFAVLNPDIQLYNHYSFSVFCFLWFNNCCHYTDFLFPHLLTINLKWLNHALWIQILCFAGKANVSMFCYTQSIHSVAIPACALEGRRGAGADPRWCWVRCRVHPGQTMTGLILFILITHLFMFYQDIFFSIQYQTISVFVFIADNVA